MWHFSCACSESNEWFCNHRPFIIETSWSNMPLNWSLYQSLCSEWFPTPDSSSSRQERAHPRTSTTICHQTKGAAIWTKGIHTRQIIRTLGTMMNSWPRKRRSSPPTDSGRVSLTNPRAADNLRNSWAPMMKSKFSRRSLFEIFVLGVLADCLTQDYKRGHAAFGAFVDDLFFFLCDTTSRAIHPQNYLFAAPWQF